MRCVVGVGLFRVLLHGGVDCARLLVMLVNALKIRLELVWYRLVDAHLEIPTYEDIDGEIHMRSAKDTYLKF